MIYKLLLLTVCAACTGVLPAQTLLANRVSMTTQGTYRVIRSNGIPDHLTGRFPSRNNPNAITEKDYTWRIPMNPKVAAAPIPSGWAWFGVAVNGVPMEPGTQEFYNEDRNSGWTYEALGGTSNLGIDQNLAHVQPNGAYHYHGMPTGLIQRLGGDSNRMVLVGWAADGFPIYTSMGYSDPKSDASSLRTMKSSYRLKHGSRPDPPGNNYDGNFTQDFEFVPGSGDLDECNGRFGVTPEYPAGIYHYHITSEFPFISRSWRGEPDESFQKHGPPPGTFPHKGVGSQNAQSAARASPTPPPRPTHPSRPNPQSRRPPR